MKKLTLLLLLMSGYFALNQISAQTRYLNQVFARNQIQVQKNVIYGVNATILYQSVFGEAVPQPLLMDVYTPASDTETNRPLVLYFHTGNFLPFFNPANPAQPGFNGSCGGERNDSAAVEICTRLAQMGYTVASCTYRQGWLPTSTIPEVRRYTLINAAYRGVQDASSAIRFFRRSADIGGDPFGIDPSKIVLFGQGTGGYISLNTALLDDYNKIPTATNGKFIWNPRTATGNPCAPNALIPMVIQAVNGDLTATAVGISPIYDPANGCAIIKLDTLCYENWPGYSSDFNLAVNLGGALGDSSWIDNALQNPQPALISFQVPNDPFAPYTSGVLSVPGQDPPLQVVEVQGAYVVQALMESAGQQQVLVDANDEYLDLQANQLQAFANSPDTLQAPRTALYPFVMPPDPNNPQLPTTSAPWEWTSFPGLPPIPGVTNGFTCNTNKAAALPYIDTIMRFYAPRACFALGLQGCIDQVLSAREPLAKNIQLVASPNPATDQVTLRAEAGNTILAVQVIDKTGRLIANTQNVGNDVYTFRRGNLPPGLYIFKVSFQEGFATKMVVFE
ncbi:MAG: T9SS type A sorting domain-containing protein [Saprospirales bacterium]|nr:T9SS type A sorting domain-containing protein [Saprospirales bacterium]MBK8922131.1 T9SS type A sorting domain-containing protein [Saprospirales bacterium]